MAVPAPKTIFVKPGFVRIGGRFGPTLRPASAFRARATTGPGRSGAWSQLLRSCDSGASQRPPSGSPPSNAPQAQEEVMKELKLALVGIVAAAVVASALLGLAAPANAADG